MTLGRRELLAMGAATWAGCAAPPSAAPEPEFTEVLPAGIEPPQEPVREFRGAWVATVSHIDWPRPKVFDADAQRAQARALVGRAAQLGLNALLLQVRPACDALYASTLEPWSEYVSGVQGLDPGYDPLAMWVDEAHRAGLQLHAWFNPFRARHPSAQSPLAAQHVASRQPGWVLRYGDLLWLDPGLPEAREHSLAVVADVVRRYDIDGVHIDDYFYPYPVKQGDVEAPFPDDASYAQHANIHEKGQAREAWRRSNVNAFVQALHAQTKAAKPWVLVSISPFGLPRPDLRPPGVAGFSAYDKLYADAEHWMAQGWCDAISPQLYWPMASSQQPFAPLLTAWAQANTLQRHLWPGLYTSSVGTPPRAWPADEIRNQIAHLRQQRTAASGHIHFSAVALMDNRGGLADTLANPGLALPPASPWLNAEPPRASLQWQRGDNILQLQAGDAARGWLIHSLQGARWRSRVQYGGPTLQVPLQVPLQDDAGPVRAIQAQALSGSGVLGNAVSWARDTTPKPSSASSA
jgi:uncharacterized lipoprotein YddW (UPF0748 family)